MRKQQKQTLKFFVENAKNWLSEDVFNNKKIQSSQQQRNMFVYNYIKKNRPNNFLDIGCVTCNLVNKVFFYVKKNLSGIDFSKSMIDLANKKKINERIQYKCVDILKFKSNIKYDVISANGFIEYFSKKELILIFSKIKKLLTKNGKIFFSVRNRLFNVFSLNEFTKLEMNSNKIHNLLRESFAIVNSSFSKFKRNKSLK
jgi:cyclopropane fatty-acyl-phospholipid synthase-like methyltransferase